MQSDRHPGFRTLLASAFVAVLVLGISCASKPVAAPSKPAKYATLPVKAVPEFLKGTILEDTDLIETDREQKRDVLKDHPEIAAKLTQAYERWWTEVLPMMVNENAKGPQVNPFKELYRKQFGQGF